MKIVEESMGKTISLLTISLWCAASGAEALPADCPTGSEGKETSRALAGTWFSKGMSFAGEGRYAEAEEAFRCSHRIVPHPATLLNVAKAARHTGAIERAIETYRTYLDKYPEDDKAGAVREEIARLEEDLPGPASEAPAPAERIPDNAPSSPPEPAGSDSPPEEQPSSMEWNLPVVDGDLSVTGGPAVAEPPPPASPDRRNGLAIAGGAVIGVGGAILIAGIATGATALSEKRYLDTHCDPDGCAEQYHGRIDSMARLGYATDALIGIGGTAIGLGIVLLVMSRLETSETSASLSVRPMISPEFSGIGITGGFE